MAAPASTRTTAAFVYVSNAVDASISIYRLDRASGALALLGAAPAGMRVMPLAISPDRRHLYASLRAQPHSVATYRIDAKTGALAHIATAPLPDSMTYIATDRSGRWLFGASYSGDVISVSPIDAHGIARDEAPQVIRTGRHPHAIQPGPSNRIVYATLLGTDQVLQFDFDPRTGRLSPSRVPFTAVARGAGPRHFAFAPNGGFVYVLSERAGTVTSFAVDPATGNLTQLDDIAGVPASFGLAHGVIRPPHGDASAADEVPRIWASDIHVRPDGRFLYVAERTTSSISTIACDTATGKLAFVANLAVEKQPRGFNVDPTGSYAVVAGEKSPEVGVYVVDAARGTLDRVARAPGGRGANWVEIVEFD